MNTKCSAIGLFFCFFTLFTLTDCSTCEENKLEGQSLTLPLTNRPLVEGDQYTVTKDDKILFKRKTIQPTKWVEKNTLLELQHAQLSDKGTYSVTVYDKNGVNLNLYKLTICVYAKVPMPRINRTCQDEKVYFRCDVDSNDVTYSWQKDGTDLNHKKVSLEIVKASNSMYSCTAQNPVYNITSDLVEGTCYTSPTLFGFDFLIMVSILAGGGGLVLLLTIVLVTVACRSCKRKEKQLRDEEEFRLNYLNTAPSNGQQKSKSTARGQPAPPEPYDNVSAHDVPCETESKPKKQHRARPPPPPEEDEEEPPPPLPQPRKVKKREA